MSIPFKVNAHLFAFVSVQFHPIFDRPRLNSGNCAFLLKKVGFLYYLPLSTDCLLFSDCPFRTNRQPRYCPQAELIQSVLLIFDVRGRTQFCRVLHSVALDNRSNPLFFKHKALQWRFKKRAQLLEAANWRALVYKNKCFASRLKNKVQVLTWMSLKGFKQMRPPNSQKLPKFNSHFFFCCVNLTMNVIMPYHCGVNGLQPLEPVHDSAKCVQFNWSAFKDKSSKLNLAPF